MDVAAFQSSRLTLIALWMLFISSVAAPASDQKQLWIDFTNGISEQWNVKLLARRPNHFAITNDNGNKVLRVHSSSSASGIFMKWQIEELASGTLSWKWKVNSSLVKNSHERSRKGDDYAARIFLLFEPHLFTWRTPNVCYVWAGNLPVGSIFKSPHSDSVCTIVLQSGNENAQQWMHEERDFIADYLRCFQRPPKTLSAVAIMADTDDTRSSTTAWLDEIRITASSM